VDRGVAWALEPSAPGAPGVAVGRPGQLLLLTRSQPTTPVSTHWPVLADCRIASHTFCVWRTVRNVGSAGARRSPRPSEIGDRMRQDVLVADGQAGHPPVIHVRMLGIGDGRPWKVSAGENLFSPPPTPSPGPPPRRGDGFPP
jgi:hypothetical protein